MLLDRYECGFLMNYKTRIDKVLCFIGEHLDEDLTVDQLCKVACFSKYHFHRLFTAYTGVSLQAYIKWLRLKRAAHQLIVHKQDAILNIALDAGFESHEAFSRSFKQICGQTPSEFRSKPIWYIWENPPHALHIKGEKIMTISIKEYPARRLAVVEHRGDPMKLSYTLDKLITWAKSQPIDVKPKPGQAFGFGYHDPREVPPEEFRFDLALTVPQNFTLTGDVIEKVLPHGRYAVISHKGSRDNIGDTISSLYRDWLPESGEQLGDLPCVFCYYNFDHEVAETELLTEIWVLLK